MKLSYKRLFFILSLTGFVLSGTSLYAEDQKPNQSTVSSTQEKSTFDDAFAAVKKLAEEKKLIDAQKQAKALIPDAVSEEQRLKLARLLREIRFELLFSKKQTDTSERYEVKSDDTLGKIAKKYNTTIELIRKTNKIKKNVVWTGMKLKVEKVPFSIEISIPKNVLWLKQGEHYVKKYRVSTGEKGNTPTGNVKIANKVINPSWYYNDQIYPPGDPKNGLGTRWMGFDLKGYGIHGTIEPEKIGKPASLGCVRMRNEDVEELFDLVPVGTPVIIRKS